MSGGGGERRLSLLVVTNMYPADDNPMFGGFIGKQTEMLRSLGVPFQLVANRRWKTGALENARKYASLLARVAVAALRGDFDVIVAHFLYPTAWFARIASVLSGKPYVLVVHGTDVRSVQRRDPIASRSRAAVRRATRIVCVSNALADQVRTEFELPSSVPIDVVNMGVDRSVFHPISDARSVLGLPVGARVVLFAGNLTRQKNLEVLIPAFQQARDAGAADILIVAGADREGRGAALEADVHERGMGDVVRFVGVLTADQLAAAMSAADVFVLPSLAEALGVVLLEAMACGTPVVASRVGGIPEVVAPECGVLVEPTDVEGFAEAMAEVIELGKPFFAEGCATAAAANDVREMTRRLVEVAGRAARGEV